MKNIIEKYNLLFFIPLAFIIIASMFCMYQATFIKDIYKGHLFKQIIWFSLGFLIIFILQKIKVKFLFRYSFILYLIGNILLVLVLFFGHEINGAKAWFSFKYLSFQPSEFMKIALLLYLANLTHQFQVNKKEMLFILKSIIVFLIPSILVFLEPDTGAIVIFFLLLLSTILLSGIRKRWFIIAFVIISCLGGTFLYLYFFKQDLLIKYIGTSFFYRMDRIINFKDKAGLQLNNALITIGNANILGHGIKQEILFVPEFPTDFVFTLYISIFGFLGGFILILSFFTIDYFFISHIQSINEIEYKCFLNGFIFLFLFQQIQNIFMNLGLSPIMGIPLPFLSYGGSNMIIFFSFIGIIFNILKKKN